MRKTIDIVLASTFLLVGAGLLVTTFGDSFKVRTFGGDVGPAFAPRLFLTTWSIFAAIALVQALRSEAGEFSGFRLGQFLLVVVIGTLTALAMTRIGFVFATIPGLAAFCWAFGYRKVIPLVVISLLTPFGVWAVFTFGFELLLPHSRLFYQI